MPSGLSFNALKSFHPLAILPGAADKTFFDLLDFGIAELLLPLNALLIALFAGWAIRRTLTPARTDLSPARHRIWHVLTGIGAPGAITVLIVYLLAY